MEAAECLASEIPVWARGAWSVSNLLLLGGRALVPVVARGMARRVPPVSWRLAWKVRNACPFPVPWRDLKNTLSLSFLQTTLACATPEAAEELVDNLDVRLSLSRKWRDLRPVETRRRAEAVALECQRQLLLVVSGPQAAAILDERADLRHTEVVNEQRTVASLVVDVGAGHQASLAELKEALAGSARPDEVVQALPSSLRTLGLEALRTHDQAKRIIDCFETSPDRERVLSDWTAAPPTWLTEVGPQAWLLIAEIAALLDDKTTAAAAVERALLAGASPRRYWLTRQAHWHLGSDDERALAILDGHSETQHGAYPYADVVRLLAAGDDLAGSVPLLESWQPENTHSERLRAMFRSARSFESDVNAAIAILVENGADERADSSTLMLAQWLVARAQRREGLDRETDLEQAFNCAVRVRNTRRTFRLDGVEAAGVAADAMILRHDWAAVTRITNAPPDGEATENEAAHPDLRRRAGMAAAVTGEFGKARELAADNPFETAWLEATAAEVGSGFLQDPSQATDEQDTLEADDKSAADRLALWERAWAAASTDQEKVNAARGLLLAGRLDFPGLAELRESQPQAIVGTERLARALAETPSNPVARASRLRALSTELDEAAVHLAQMHFSEGDIEGGCEVLDRAADRFQRPQLRVMAANYAGAAQKWDLCERLGEAALLQAGSTWPGARAAEGAVYRAALARGDWNKAARLASSALALDPANDLARWTVIAAEYNRGSLSKAWQVLDEAPGLTEPNDRSLELIRLDLMTRFGPPEKAWTEAVRLLQLRSDEERFAAQVLTLAFRLGAAGGDQRQPRMDEEHDEDSETPATVPPELAALHAAAEDFFHRFPDSEYLRQLTFRDIDDLLAQLTALIAPGAEVRKKFAHDISLGLLPVGIASLLRADPYALQLLRAGQRCVFIRSLNLNDIVAGTTAATEAFRSRSPVWLDASALSVVAGIAHLSHSLTSFDGQPVANITDVARRLLTSVPGLRVTDTAFADIVAARDAAQVQSVMSAHYDTENDQLVFVEEDEEEARVIAERAALMYDLIQAVPTAPEESTDDSRLRGPEFDAWMGNVRAAQVSGSTLWCDDSALAQIARSLGVATFNTTDLLDVLAAAGAVDGSERVELDLHLRTLNCVDLPFDVDAIRLVGERQEWAPRAAAVAISRPHAWLQPRNTIRLLQAGLQHAKSSRRDSQEWAAAGLRGFSFVRQEDQPEIVVPLLVSLLIQPWTTEVTLYGLVAALHDTLPETADELWELVLGHAVTALTAAHGEGAGVQLMLRLCRGLDEPHRIAAAKVCLRTDR